MSKESIISYCQHCCNTFPEYTKQQLYMHERLCYKNPANKTCATCGNCDSSIVCINIDKNHSMFDKCYYCMKKHKRIAEDRYINEEIKYEMEHDCEDYEYIPEEYIQWRFKNEASN
jgi:hypothetical protein